MLNNQLGAVTQLNNNQNTGGYNNQGNNINDDNDLMNQ